ncbi:hypothetical protein DIPPA_30250 [Diplonema papillatum]|nr:hypothetical protein DIPPA_30250 [Diplonema papillatum]
MASPEGSSNAAPSSDASGSGESSDDEKTTPKKRGREPKQSNDDDDDDDESDASDSSASKATNTRKSSAKSSPGPKSTPAKKGKYVAMVERPELPIKEYRCTVAKVSASCLSNHGRVFSGAVPKLTLNPSLNCAAHPRLSPFLTEIQIKLGNDVLAPMKPLTRHAHTDTDDFLRTTGRRNETLSTPPIHFLASGLAFPTSLQFCPSTFQAAPKAGGGATDPFRILLVSGSRVPTRYMVERRGSCIETKEDPPEAHAQEAAVLSRYIQLWYISVPLGPHVAQNTAPVVKAAMPGQFLLKLPAADADEAATAWSVRGVRWFGSDEESLVAELKGAFGSADPAKKRLGIVGCVTDHGAIMAYAVQQAPGMIGDLVPFAHCVHRGSSYTSLAWHVRSGEVSIFAGMANGDVAWAFFTTGAQGAATEIVVTCHLTTQQGPVKSLAIFPTWVAATEEGIKYDSDDSAPELLHSMPLVDWPASDREPETDITGSVPAIDGIEVHDLLISVGLSDRKLCAYDVDLLTTSRCHGSLLESAFAGCILPLPYGVLLIGLHDGTIRVCPPPGPAHYCDSSPTPSVIKPSVEYQSAITCMDYVTDNRRKPDKKRRRVKGSSKHAPTTDSIVCYATANGTVGTLRYPRRVLNASAGTKRCTVCRNKGVKNSWTLAACDCAVDAQYKSHVEESPLLLFRDTQWLVPTEKERPKIKYDLTVLPTSEELDEHKTRTYSVAGFAQAHHYMVAMAAGGLQHSHLVAVASPGGLIVVLPM